ncbi:hypothetical protein MBLNU457_5824t1 [Dothideomycetes sp. NU457]
MNALTNVLRTVERSANTQAVAYVCRSCQTRLASTQQRQIQNAKLRTSSSSTSRAYATTSRLPEEKVDPLSNYRDPKSDPNYVEATRAEELQWIGSDKWVEKQQDKGDNPKTWGNPAPIQVPAKSADRIIIQVAQKVLDKESLKAMQIDSVKKGETVENNTWLSTPLTDPKIKFEMVKGIAKATGYRISDYQLQSVKTWKGLKHSMLQSPPSKKLYTRLTKSKTFENLPNVALIQRRVTPIDKEKTIGRWKLIEEELTERGLPVTGETRNIKKSFSTF